MLQPRRKVDELSFCFRNKKGGGKCQPGGLVYLAVELLPLPVGFCCLPQLCHDSSQLLGQAHTLILHSGQHSSSMHKRQRRYALRSTEHANA